MKKIAIALFATAAIAAVAQQVKVEDQVKLRRAAYRLMGLSMSHLGAMAQEKKPFNKEEAQRYADLIGQVSTIPREYFGEGITEWKGSIYQLTWQTQIGFVYDLATFQQTKTFNYRGEGWGLTHDGSRLIMSDGSSSLRFLDPSTLQETGRLRVRDHTGPIDQLNELEYVRGEIFANIWQTERIARISPKDGRVTGWIDLSGLLSPMERGGADVLNGIAYDPAGDRLFVTGKWWPRLFEIKIVPRSGARGGRQP